MVNSEFLLAGNAVFTVVNPKGDRYTFNVRKSDPTPQFPVHSWFAYVLVGPDNTEDYKYLGMLKVGDGTRMTHLHATKATRTAGHAETDTVFKVCDWAIKVISYGGYSLKYEGNTIVPAVAGLPDGYSIIPSTNCAKCGRLLTVPESIERGLGPDCAAA